MDATTLDRRADSLPVGVPVVTGAQINRKMVLWQGSGVAIQLATIAIALAFAVLAIVGGWSQGSVAGGLLGAGSAFLLAGTMVAYSRRRASALPYPTNSFSVALGTALNEVDKRLHAARPIAERRRRLQDMVPALNEAFATFLGQPCSTVSDMPLTSSHYEKSLASGRTVSARSG